MNLSRLIENNVAILSKITYFHCSFILFRLRMPVRCPPHTKYYNFSAKVRARGNHTPGTGQPSSDRPAGATASDPPKRQ